jgi:hypothetical protein
MAAPTRGLDPPTPGSGPISRIGRSPLGDCLIPVGPPEGRAGG